MARAEAEADPDPPLLDAATDFEQAQAQGVQHSGTILNASETPASARLLAPDARTPRSAPQNVDAPPWLPGCARLTTSSSLAMIPT